ICGKPVLHGLEVESDFIRKGRLLYIPSWVNRGDIRNYIPQLEKVIESKRLSWGTLKNNSPSLRAERNKKIRERHNVLRKKGIGYTKATEMMADEFFCSAKTVQRIICNSKSDK
ncbi:MAG TPA: hypothetical protein ACFYEK_12595, partial [Candidatus Wunengus sp. YC60]|uniref:hypothetical protein n=1 Tax=Candidatus Wunengus sp. YC60 TaxID=3367697 RepID=UPI00402906B7